VAPVSKPSPGGVAVRTRACHSFVVDQREWDYGARMPRDRRAGQSWSTQVPERSDLPESDSQWPSLTDTGSMTPSPEALAWQQRADAWAQQAEGDQSQAVEPANRWSEVASTGSTAFPADGVGWRSETAEWRSSSAHWRQTTEWRSTTGSHGWRSTTEAWQTGGNSSYVPPADTPTSQPAIASTAWTPPGSDPLTGSTADGGTPSWQSASSTNSWQQGQTWQPEQPWQPEQQSWQQEQPWQQEPQPWQQEQQPWQQEQSWQPEQQPWQQEQQAAPGWQQPAPRQPAESSSSWQHLVDNGNGGAGGAAEQPSWSSRGAGDWQRTAIDGTATWSDMGETRAAPASARANGSDPESISSWLRMDDPAGAPSWQQPRDDGRHMVREDDRAAWRRGAEQGGESPSVGRRRAADGGARSSAGTGWAARSDADNWPGHTDTGNIPIYTDEAPAWSAGQTSAPRYDAGPTTRYDVSGGRRALPAAPHPASGPSSPYQTSGPSGPYQTSGPAGPYQASGPYQTSGPSGPYQSANPAASYQQPASGTPYAQPGATPYDTSSRTPSYDPAARSTPWDATARTTPWDAAARSTPYDTAGQTPYEAPGRTPPYDPTGRTPSYETNGRTAPYETNGRTAPYDATGRTGAYDPAGQGAPYDPAGRPGAYETPSRHLSPPDEFTRRNRHEDAARPLPMTDYGTGGTRSSAAVPLPIRPASGPAPGASAPRRNRYADESPSEPTGGFASGPVYPTDLPAAPTSGFGRRRRREEPDTGYGSATRGPAEMPRTFAEPGRDHEMPRGNPGLGREMPRDLGDQQEGRRSGAGRRRTIGSPSAPGGGRPREDTGGRGREDTGGRARDDGGRARENGAGGRQTGGRARYKQAQDDWREQTGSWAAEPDTSSWVRDPDTGQWSRSQDDPRVHAWRDEAARREAPGPGERRALPAGPSAAQRPDRDDDWRGGGSGAAPASGMPGIAPRSAMPGNAPRSGTAYGVRRELPSGRDVDPDEGGTYGDDDYDDPRGGFGGPRGGGPRDNGGGPRGGGGGGRPPRGDDRGRRGGTYGGGSYDAPPRDYGARSNGYGDRGNGGGRGTAYGSAQVSAIPSSAVPGSSLVPYGSGPANAPRSGVPYGSIPSSAIPDGAGRPTGGGLRRAAADLGYDTGIGPEERVPTASASAPVSGIRSRPDEPPSWARGPQLEPGAWQVAERAEAARGAATYRGGGGDDWRREFADPANGSSGDNGGSPRYGAGGDDWRRELADSANGGNDGESPSYASGEFAPFRASGSAAVMGSANLSGTATSLITPVPQRESWARGSDAYPSLSGSYERRPVTGGFPVIRRGDLLDPDDEEDELDAGGPLAAVGYTVIWYGVPIVLFVLYMLLVDSGSRGQALNTLANAAPQFGVSLVLSVLVAIGIRKVTDSWKAISVGLAAAVVGGGLATVISSAITGNSLS
jgi:hypothetical protein